MRRSGETFHSEHLALQVGAQESGYEVETARDVALMVMADAPHGSASGTISVEFESCTGDEDTMGTVK
jgi:hypothetical protein